MRRFAFILSFVCLVLAAFLGAGTPPEGAGQRFAIALHGGAGAIAPMADARQATYKAHLRKALQAGYAILQKGESSLEAVEATLRVLESDSLFNAGRGSVLSLAGRAEMDASLMRGRDRQAGAVAAVTALKHPISGARVVLEHSPHVLLVGEGAEKFAKSKGAQTAPAHYFKTQEEIRRLRNIRRRQNAEPPPAEKNGTVGCVALDQNGNLAAGTSTGGTPGKAFGRIGDSPIIGAGTYADNRTCAVSCTGHGEIFMRGAAAFAVHARMKHRGQSLEAALEAVIHQDLAEMEKGAGGAIGLDAQGNIHFSFSTQGMFRGFRKAGEKAVFRIYPKD